MHAHKLFQQIKAVVGGDLGTVEVQIYDPDARKYEAVTGFTVEEDSTRMKKIVKLHSDKD